MGRPFAIGLLAEVMPKSAGSRNPDVAVQRTRSQTCLCSPHQGVRISYELHRPKAQSLGYHGSPDRNRKVQTWLNEAKVFSRQDVKRRPKTLLRTLSNSYLVTIPLFVISITAKARWGSPPPSSSMILGRTTLERRDSNREPLEQQLLNPGRR